MKRTRSTRRALPSRNAEKLAHLATQLSLSSCRIEDHYWESLLNAQVNRMLADREEDTLIAVLDQLYANPTSRAYDELADIIESCAESFCKDGSPDMDTVMIAVPVLAWSRFQIPSGIVAAARMEALRAHLHAHVLAANAKLGLANVLFSPDQLPQSYVDTATLSSKLTKAALHDQDLKFEAGALPETVSFLSDNRYLVGAIAAPKGSPLFRWQEDDGDRNEAFRQWIQQGGETVRALMPACALEFMPVMAYHAAVRDADRASRPWSLRAGVAFLQTMLNVAPKDLRAVIAPFHDQQLEEFRVGFTLRGNNDVLHGVVWPMLENNEDGSETPAQIEAVLREAGLEAVLVLDQRFPLEFCDDCGAPLYPNPEGEPVHAELPEEQNEPASRNLH